MNNSDKVDHQQQNDSSELAFQFCRLQELSNAYRDRDKEQKQEKIKIGGREYKLRIPPIQRGLVWNPAQVETLWDSIMRGFPIGSLSLLHGDDSDTMEIIDGQQRTNAISLGFQDPFSENNGETEGKEHDAILWIDLLPDEKTETKRQFHFCLTTSSHPWGYALSNSLDEKETPLLKKSETFSNLFDEFFSDGFTYKKPDVLELWPFKAVLPMPFSLLRSELLDNANEETFADYISKSDYGQYNEGINKGKQRKWWKHFETMVRGKLEVWEKISELRKQIKCRLEKYEIPMMIIPRSTIIDDKSVSDNDTIASNNLSVYFSRLNTNGTIPNDEEIRYSVLKAAIPELKELEDKLNKSDINIMRPSRMATMAVRLFMSEEEKKWVDSITQKDIRNLSTGQDSSNFRNSITTKDQFKSRIDALRNSILFTADREWGIPKYLLAIIAQHNPNLFLFLLLLIRRTKNGKKLVGLATLLHMFSTHRINYKKAFETILEDKNDDSLWNRVSMWLGSTIRSQQLILPPSVETFERIRDASHELEDLKHAWHPEEYETGLNRVWSWGNGRPNEAAGNVLTIYACRKYMEDIFKQYDPVSTAYKDDTCPWDKDHIIPRSWYESRKGKKRNEAKKLIESTGNLAHIPFCINRAKSNNPPFNFCGNTKYMHSHNKNIYIDEQIWNVDKYEILTYNVDMKQEKYVLQAAPLITSRLHDLYKAWYGGNHPEEGREKGLDIEELLNFKGESDGILHVKNAPEIIIFDKLRKLLKEASGEKEMPLIYYPYDGVLRQGEQAMLKDVMDYCRPCLASGYETTSKDIKGIISIALTGDCEYVEYGLRRYPSEKQIDGDPNKWWHSRPDAMPSGQWENTQGNLLYKNGRLADYNNETKMNELIGDLMTLYRFYHDN